MSRTARRWMHGLLAAGIVMGGGCASAPKIWPFSRQASTPSSSTMAQATGGARSSWSQALRIQPKVVKAPDPTALQTKSPRVTADIHLQTAQLHEVRGNVPEAVAAYQRALQLDPNRETTLLSFARLYDRQGNFAEAQRLYERAATSHPRSPQVFNDYGLCAVRQGRIDQGLKLLGRAVDLAPENALYRNNLAQTLVGLGRDDEALRQLRAVHSEEAARYNIAYWHWSSGRGEQAAAHLGEALRANPQLTQAQQLMAAIQEAGAPMMASNEPLGGPQTVSVDPAAGMPFDPAQAVPAWPAASNPTSPGPTTVGPTTAGPYAGAPYSAPYDTGAFGPSSSISIEPVGTGAPAVSPTDL